MLGIDPVDLGERKAAAAEFSSLPILKKHEWVTGVVYLSLSFHIRKRYERYLKKKKVEDDGWLSYLNEEELMMVGDLDKVDAENLYNRSQEKGYKSLSLQERLEYKKIRERMMGLTIEEDDYFDGLIFPQSDDEGAFSDTKINQTDEGPSERINIYDDQERNKILADVEIYRMRIAELNQMWKKRKLEKLIDIMY